MNRFLLITGDDGQDEVRSWLEAVSAPRLRQLDTRRVPGLLIVDVDVVAAGDRSGP